MTTPPAPAPAGQHAPPAGAIQAAGELTELWRQRAATWTHIADVASENRQPHTVARARCHAEAYESCANDLEAAAPLIAEQAAQAQRAADEAEFAARMDTWQQAMAKIHCEAVQNEREACAQLAESQPDLRSGSWHADQIRKRGAP